MKTLIKIFAFVIGMTFLSCATTKSALNRITPGMSVSEFKKEVPKATLHKFYDDISIYRLDANVWVQSDWTPQYFYFTNNKLTSTDRGQRAVDYRSREDINININIKQNK